MQASDNPLLLDKDIKVAELLKNVAGYNTSVPVPIIQSIVERCGKTYTSPIVPKLIGAHIDSTICEILVKAKLFRDQRIIAERKKMRAQEDEEKRSRKRRKKNGEGEDAEEEEEEKEGREDGGASDEDEEIKDSEELKLVDFIKPLQEIGVDISGKLDEESGEVVY